MRILATCRVAVVLPMEKEMKGRSSHPKEGDHRLAHADASAADSGNVEHAELDPTTLMALQEHTEAFVCGFSPSEDTEDPPLQESQLKQALELARANSSLHTLGVDGTGCALSADTARALSIPVKALKFVGLLSHAMKLA